MTRPICYLQRKISIPLLLLPSYFLIVFLFFPKLVWPIDISPTKGYSNCHEKNIFNTYTPTNNGRLYLCGYLNKALKYNVFNISEFEVFFKREGSDPITLHQASAKDNYLVEIRQGKIILKKLHGFWVNISDKRRKDGNLVEKSIITHETHISEGKKLIFINCKGIQGLSKNNQVLRKPIPKNENFISNAFDNNREIFDVILLQALSGEALAINQFIRLKRLPGVDGELTQYLNTGINLIDVFKNKKCKK